MGSGMTIDVRLVVKVHGNGSRFTVQVEAQNIRGSTLLRHERHATDTPVASLASENARRAEQARRAIGQFGLSGLFGSSGLFGLSGSSCLSGLSRLFSLSGLSSKVFDETRDGSARFVACLARIIHDGSSAPHPSLPYNMGEGEGGGAETVARQADTGYETRDTGYPVSRIANFESRFPRQSRPPRLSSASAITAEALMNHAG